MNIAVGFVCLVTMAVVEGLPNVEEGGGCCRGKGCKFGDNVYPIGAMAQGTCMKLECIEGDIIGYGVWNYTAKIDKDCETCMVWGDPHIYTFGDDSSEYGSKSFEYSKLGHYAITHNGLVQESPFGVNSEFVECVPGHSAPTCIKSVTYYEPGISITMQIPEPDNKCTTDNAKGCSITVYVNGEIIGFLGSSVVSLGATGGTVLAVRHNHISYYTDGKLDCMNVIGTKGLSITFCSTYENYAYLYVWPTKSLKSNPSELYGLCGTYSGKPQYPYTERTGSTTNEVNTFADTWEISSTPTNGVTKGVTNGVDVSKCFSDRVLSYITTKCLNLTKGACQAMPPACDALKAACEFDLCRMPIKGYLAGYANHMASLVVLLGN